MANVRFNIVWLRSIRESETQRQEDQIEHEKMRSWHCDGCRKFFDTPLPEASLADKTDAAYERALDAYWSR